MSDLMDSFRLDGKVALVTGATYGIGMAIAEALGEAGEDYSAADTAFHNAIAESCGNLVVPRLMGVFKTSVPLFIDITGKKLVEETIRTHRGVADAIAARNPTAAHDAMYLHLVYNRNMIAEGAQAKSE